MSGKNRPPSSSTPVPPLTSPTGVCLSSRRGSVASASLASNHLDKEQLAQALDKIHTSANQQDILTTFNDLEPPPDTTAAEENKGLTSELVQHGLSGLSKYFRFKGDSSGGSGSGNKDKEKEKEKEREKPTSKSSQETSDATVHDANSTGRQRGGSTSTVGTSSRNSLPPVPRNDTTMTLTTFNSNISDPTAQTTTSIAGLAPEGHSQQPLSAKVSSTTNLPTIANSKSSSRQSISSLGAKPIAAIAPVNVNAFKDSTRPSPINAEDPAARGNGRKSMSKSPDGPPSFTMSEAKSTSSLDKSLAPSRSRRDNAPSVDGSVDSPVSPMKSSIHSAISAVQSISDPNVSQSTRLSARDQMRRPAVIDRLNRSRSRASDVRSNSSSVSQGAAEASNISTSAHNSVNHDSFGPASKPERMKSGDFRIPGTTTDEGAPEIVNAKLESMRKQVLSKDFWMADETCSECFECGAPFTAFRRKHHCRTCGCIFDSRCTSIISGQKFGVQGTLRVCKRCLHIISQRQDGNVSDDSADDSYLPAIFRTSSSKAPSARASRIDRDDASISERTEDVDDTSRSLSTPLMAIPATRRVGDSSNRSSAVLEIDAPQLSRPSSSRSLRSMTSGRPQSSGHRRHNSKHNLLNRLRPTPEGLAPFRKSANEEVLKKSGLPFHDDNVIDPDLAPYMSDESSGDEQMSLFATLAGDEPRQAGSEHEKANLGSYLGVARRNRARTQAEKSISGFSYTSRGVDEGSGIMLHPRSSTRRRNMSTASAHMRSPRPRSALLKGPSASTETLPLFDSPTPPVSRLTRSSSMKGEKEPRLELNPASLLHVRKLLRQLLEDAKVPNVKSWEKALVPILLKCTSSVDPDIDRGDDMDIRHYVKLKKIPGGRPSDTTYVSGVIFTKKMALKSMARRISNPRVVLVSFPIEYQRHQQHFMSLQPVIEQEKEFLSRMVSRISALRPQLLLAEKGVSGLALQLFSEANIAVAYNVKPSVLSAVSRCLETEIISSLDMLALPRSDFQTGKSNGCEVKTFVNSPAARRPTSS